jgi:hypothetical protein
MATSGFQCSGNGRDLPVQTRRTLRVLCQFVQLRIEDTWYLGSQDTFYVGTLKGVGRIYQQTFVDTYSKVAAAKGTSRVSPYFNGLPADEKGQPLF